MHSRRKKAVGQEGEKGFRMLPNKKLVQIHKKCYPEMEDELYTLELSSKEESKFVRPPDPIKNFHLVFLPNANRLIETCPDPKLKYKSLSLSIANGEKDYVKKFTFTELAKKYKKS